MRLSQAIEGFLLEKSAQRLSPHTISDYINSFRKLQSFLGDPEFADITADQIRAFLADLEKPRAPAGIAPRLAKPLSKKQILNIHTGLSALWTWAVKEGITSLHILREIPRPRPEKPAIVPFSREDVKALLDACDRSRPYKRPGKRESDHAVPTALRNRAIVLLLVDTGIRASELCNLKISDVDLKNRRVVVFGKGSKERSLPISATTAKAIWKYLASRDSDSVHAPLFTTTRGRNLTRHALLDLLDRLGQRAGVPHVHPHRFRHTFAIHFLRNGGNAYELQMALGHTTLEMVKTYLTLAQTDLEAAHRRASPVENWRLS